MGKLGERRARGGWIPWLVGAIAVASFFAMVGAAIAIVRKVRAADPRAEPDGVISNEPAPPPEPEIAMTIYDGGLQNGWQDWGWGPRQLEDGGAAHVGFANYGAIVLRHSRLSSSYGSFEFRILAPKGYGSFLEVSLEDKTPAAQAFPHVVIGKEHEVLLADGWKRIVVPWTALDPSGAPFDRIVMRAKTSVGIEAVSINKVILGKQRADADAGTKAPGSRDVRMAINCAGPSHRISELIYGLVGDVSSAGSRAARLGGNTMSRFNWDLGNVWNTGSDWFFENVHGSDNGHLQEWLDDNAAHQWTTALVVPMIGWVAKDDTSSGFPASLFGAQRKHDPVRPEAGDGFKPDGKPIKPGPPTLTSVAAPPELIERWVARIREADRKRGSRSVHEYILDNEPTLWNSTHRDVHPDPIGYDELLERTIKYGSAIRRADPEAVIAGPAEWGWTGYFYSAKDVSFGVTLQPDRRLHGGTPLIEWYLRKLAEHERTTKERILDVLDVHFYPQGSRVFGSDAAVDPETAALRLRSTRALWDPSYKDESWIGEPIRLIPRLKEWIERAYPGRGISIGEWNFGAEGDMSGALAIAEVLGRFGQQNISSAYYWTMPPADSPGLAAFRAYLNFDGKGGRFLDWSMAADASAGTSLFASRDDAGGHVVAIVLNLDAVNSARATVALTGCGRSTSRDVYVYGRGMPAITKEGSYPDNDVLEETLAPYSIKVLDIQLLDRR